VGTVFDKGLFQWRDLLSSNPERSKAFYTALLGWEIVPMQMGDFTYDTIRVDGVPYGGIVAAAPGVPDYWLSYVGTPDADATAAKITELGGTVLVPPMDIPEVGRFVIAQDPTGAVFAPMHWEQPTPGVDPFAETAHGGVVWNELLTTDVDAAIAFYSALNGYTVVEDHFAEHGRHLSFAVDNNGVPTPIAGVWPLPERRSTSAWGVYFRVPNVEDAIRAIGELGGEVVTPIIETADIGRLVVAHDPTGAWFNVHETA
jgi:predicted enzyme related to lactoylglutathione lyase